MVKVKIFSIGKTKELWLVHALEEYVKRLSPILSIEWVLAKDEKKLCQLLEKEEHYIVLDEKGLQLTSIEFSKFFFKLGARISFVIGAAEGVPQEIKQRATQCISLSKLTFPHQFVRLILIEQIYRATEIEKNSHYHK